MSEPTADLSARLRAAAAAGQAAADQLTEPADIDVMGAWEPALSALFDLADVLEPPHDSVAAAIVAVLDPLPAAARPLAGSRWWHHNGFWLTVPNPNFPPDFPDESWDEVWAIRESDGQIMQVKTRSLSEAPDA